VGGVATYTPIADFFGTDSFSYTVTDPFGMSATATIFVTVNPVDDPTVFKGSLNMTTVEDTPVSVDLLTVVGDADNDLTYTFTDGANGTVSLVGSVVTYTPDPNFNGFDSFSYTVEDPDGQSSGFTATVTVNAVNDAPVATDGYLTIDEDMAGSVDLATLVSDVDNDLADLTFGATDGINGTVVLVGGVATYTPIADFFGADSFTYTVTDPDGLSATATIFVTVNPVNDAPDVQDGYLVVLEDSEGYIDLSTLASDIEDDTLTFFVNNDSSNGEPTLYQGDQAKYVPNPNFDQSDQFTFTVSDGSETITATVYVTVTAAPDPPVAVDFYGHVLDDREYLLDWSLLVTDPDTNDVLSIATLTQPANGTVTDMNDGTISFIPIFGAPSVGVFDVIVTDSTNNLVSFTATMNLLPVPTLDMVPVTGGSFDMGDHAGVGQSNEFPVHNVIVDDYQIDRFEVTNQQYVDYLNSATTDGDIRVAGLFIYQVNGAESLLATLYYGVTYDGVDFSYDLSKERFPVVEQSWYGAAHYANWLSRAQGLEPCYDELTWQCDFAVNGLRLPTEAEFEYASRAGEQTPYFQFPWASDLIDYVNANFFGGGIDTTVQIGSYAANGFGIFDISGNVLEWCNDWYDSGYYSVSPQLNPTGPVIGAGRVIRGGSWFSDSVDLRSAWRSSVSPIVRGTNLGFRLVMD